MHRVETPLCSNGYQSLPSLPIGRYRCHCKNSSYPDTSITSELDLSDEYFNDDSTGAANGIIHLADFVKGSKNTSQSCIQNNSIKLDYIKLVKCLPNSRRNEDITSDL